MNENIELKNRISDDLVKNQNRFQNQMNDIMYLKSQLHEENLKNKQLNQEIIDLKSS